MTEVSTELARWQDGSRMWMLDAKKSFFRHYIIRRKTEKIKNKTWTSRETAKTNWPEYWKRRVSSRNKKKWDKTLELHLWPPGKYSRKKEERMTWKVSKNEIKGRPADKWEKGTEITSLLGKKYGNVIGKENGWFDRNEFSAVSAYWFRS